MAGRIPALDTFDSISRELRLCCRRSCLDRSDPRCDPSSTNNGVARPSVRPSVGRTVGRDVDRFSGAFDSREKVPRGKKIRSRSSRALDSAHPTLEPSEMKLGRNNGTRRELTPTTNRGKKAGRHPFPDFGRRIARLVFFPSTWIMHGSHRGCTARRDGSVATSSRRQLGGRR